MGINRRHFVKTGLAAIGGGTLLAADAENKKKEAAKAALVGCLVDTTLCIGCRKCEEACNQRNKLTRPPLLFTDTSVFRQLRRPDENAFTVVNEFAGKPSPDRPLRQNTYVKAQCMHCLIPSCVSACIVGALKKAKDGAVVYNPDICLGCRYCLVACPFEIPAFQFFSPLKPMIRKCQFCSDRKKGLGADPACAAVCPTEALIFGRRIDLLDLAREKIQKKPDRYMKYIYGENEVGGTSWLYLTGRPIAELGLLTLPKQAPALRTEAIQHGIFKYGIIPIALYGALSGIMWYNRRREQRQAKAESDAGQAGADSSKGEAE